MKRHEPKSRSRSDDSLTDDATDMSSNKEDKNSAESTLEEIKMEPDTTDQSESESSL